MKIDVGTRFRASGKEPARLCLGRCSLLVTEILARHDEGGACRYTVRVLDGRQFALRLSTESDQWELVAAYGRAARQAAPHRQPLLPLLPLLIAALARKVFQLAKRAGKWVAHHHHPSAVPGGGAPA
jgi:hypothetical protein